MQSTESGKRHLVVVGVAIIGLAALHWWSLTRYPPPFVDEAWAADRGWALLTRGVAFGQLDAGVFEEYEAHRTYFPLLPTSIQASAMWLAGEPSLVPLRAVSLAFGALLLLTCYRLGSAMAGHAAGVLAFMLTALSAPFMYSAHLGRWDIMVAALGYSAIALLVSSGPSRVGRHVGAGLLLGLSFEIHPHASVFVLLSLVVLFQQSGMSTFRGRQAWAWLVGLAIGGLVYAVFHLSRHPKSFLSLMALAHGPTHVPPLLTLNPIAIGDGVVQAARVVYLANPLIFAAAILAGAWLVATRSVVRPVTLALASLASLGILTANKMGYYAIYVTPMFDLTLAVFVVSALQGPRRLIPAPLVLAAAGILAACGITANLMVLRRDGSAEFHRALALITPNVRPGEALMGAQTYWFGLNRQPYYSWEQLVYFRRRYPSSSLIDAFCAFRPTVFILDGHIEQFLTESTDGPYAGRLRLPKDQLMAFLDTHGTVAVDGTNPSYGRVRVFRIDTADYLTICSGGK